MYLETARLLLREMTIDDFNELYEVFGDKENMKHYPYFFDEERVRNWIMRNIERYRVFGFGLWAIVHKETGKVIGDCGITMQDINGSIRPEIGYHIHRKFQRKGYAKEAAEECRDWAFENTPFNVLYSYMKKRNVASAATARANGMSLVGEYIDAESEQTEIYAITRQEWLKLRKKQKTYPKAE